jgi:hypothetical protein
MPQNAHPKLAAPVERGGSRGRGAHWETTFLKETKGGISALGSWDKNSSSLDRKQFQILKAQILFQI